MTQEELDALMAGDLDDHCEEERCEEKNELSDDKYEQLSEEAAKHYRVDSKKSWPPPPPTQDHKVVNQLDEVTKSSEMKAVELLDKLDSLSEFFSNIEEYANQLNAVLGKNAEVFSMLCAKFPSVLSFAELQEQNERARSMVDEQIEILQMGQDEVMMAIDAMQYQDIHRQKIERVINVMRALSKYMNSLFETNIDDESRVGSAVHIDGDINADLVSNDEIEALIASLGNK